MPPVARELSKSEFPLAEKLWEEYRQQKADLKADRIFGTFDDGKLVGLARCKRHDDGLEVDAVFVPERYRGKGYAKHAVGALVEACGKNETLFMHSTLVLVGFYRTFGFVPIKETELPPTVKARLIFCLGELEGCNAVPMKRLTGPLTGV